MGLEEIKKMSAAIAEDDAFDSKQGLTMTYVTDEVTYAGTIEGIPYERILRNKQHYIYE